MIVARVGVMRKSNDSVLVEPQRRRHRVRGEPVLSVLKEADIRRSWRGMSTWVRASECFAQCSLAVAGLGIMLKDSSIR
jgi:hypothetical protein